ncbi:preprotein translocase subunit SecY [Candidatus Micrarchaeota archaeon CG1_02_55_22]|nr:MAG: preprotein translocase subunit SecY [Candidatus Micrarchaeota archaeon CG1_02_55_22]
MSVLDTITQILPEVRRAERQPGLKEKLLWTGAVLLIFFVMGQVYPLGIDPSAVVSFERLEILFGSKIGTLTTIGIGPIVLASIFLQLATGAGLLEMDMSKPENKRRFQGLQKLLSIALAFVESAIYVYSGYLTVSGGVVFGSIMATQLFVIFQLALGSIILLYLDEVVQKYGIGSGISLFIAAGVSQAVFVGAFSLGMTETGTFLGLVPRAVQTALGGDLPNALWLLPPILSTIFVFLVVVYAEGMKIELPLAYGRARGLGARYPIKFLYVSNIPVILASAVIINIQIIGLLLYNAGVPFLGNYVNNQPVDGFAYLSSALPSPLALGGNYLAYLQFILQPAEILHILVYGLVLIVLSVVFGWFWIESTGMSAKDVAKQLERTGLQIPGFRADPRIIEGVLNRYIPVITILGAAFVGALAWFADITGALGTGTGILLTVGILYKFYEDLAQQQLFEMYPVLKRVVQ